VQKEIPTGAPSTKNLKKPSGSKTELKKETVPKIAPKLIFKPNDLNDEDFTQLEQSRPDYTPYVEEEEKINWDTVMKSSTPKIQYSVDNTKVTGNPVYKYRTNNPLGNLINNFKVGRAFEKNALPFLNKVNISNPEAVYIDPSEGIQEINNGYNDVLKNINPNSTTGQSIASNMFAKKSQAIEDYINKINTANRAASVDNRNKRATVVTSLNDYDNRAKSAYYDDYLQGQAVRDTNINNILSDLDTLNREDIQLENAYDQMINFNEGLTDKTSLLDKLIGRKQFEYNKDAAKNRLKVAGQTTA
jgi:hypothetical protein